MFVREEKKNSEIEYKNHMLSKASAYCEFFLGNFDYQTKVLKSYDLWKFWLKFSVE